MLVINFESWYQISKFHISECSKYELITLPKLVVTLFSGDWHGQLISIVLLFYNNPREYSWGSFKPE